MAPRDRLEQTNVLAELARVASSSGDGDVALRAAWASRALGQTVHNADAIELGNKC